MTDTRNAHVAEPFRSTLNGFEDATAQMAREAAKPRHPFGRDNTALIFGSVESFFEAMFGPAQHDAHVECWRSDKWLTSREAHGAAANLRCAALVDEIAEEQAQKLARVNGYSVVDLRATLHDWECGFMRGDRFAGPRVRQLRRALEIAAAHSAETNLQAAE